MPVADLVHVAFLQILTKEEGGRYTPFVQKYSPQMYFRTADVTCQLTFPPEEADAANKMVMPGDNVEMICDLVHDTPMELGSRFSLREGGKTIGTGLVSEILVRPACVLPFDLRKADDPLALRAEQKIADGKGGIKAVSLK